MEAGRCKMEADGAKWKQPSPPPLLRLSLTSSAPLPRLWNHFCAQMEPICTQMEPICTQMEPICTQVEPNLRANGWRLSG